ncbi:DUF721 domain-containing protein [Streptomyces sp. KL2]|uniref:DUF721 domain-containing protein n=1 Tax=Streptomyces sp. KL2 TaxID=3050126 RepID=UPI0039796D43
MSTEPSGGDLARQALIAAREAAKKNGTGRAKKPKRHSGTAPRRGGREPLGLGAAIGMMMTERGMTAPAVGGSVLAQFDAILTAAAPDLAGYVQAVGFDADTGRLDIAPNAPAYGTKLRWSALKLIAAANERVPGANVRTIRGLATGAVPGGSMKTRETACDGYRWAPGRRVPELCRPVDRTGGGAADCRDARAEPARVPRAGRRADPGRGEPCAAPSSRGYGSRRTAPGPAGTRGPQSRCLSGR